MLLLFAGLAPWCRARKRAVYWRSLRHGDTIGTLFGFPFEISALFAIKGRPQGAPLRLDAHALRQPHQRLPHADDSPVAHVVAQSKPVGREQDDGRSMLEPAHLLALGERCVA